MCLMRMSDVCIVRIFRIIVSSGKVFMRIGLQILEIVAEHSHINHRNHIFNDEKKNDSKNF